LAVLNLVIAGTPWGIVYGFGLWAAKIASATGAFDPSTNAFWSQSTHQQALSHSVFMDVTSITNIGILAGALWIAAGKPPSSANANKDAKTPTPLTKKQWLIGIV